MPDSENNRNPYSDSSYGTQQGGNPYRNDGDNSNPYRDKTNPYGDNADSYSDSTNSYENTGSYGNPYGNYYNSQPYYEGMYYEDDLPRNSRGKEIKNRFGLKLAFSILETLFIAPISSLFGILGIIFSGMQNSRYQLRDWAGFKKFRILSNVFLWIGLVVDLLFVGLLIVAVSILSSVYSGDLLNEMMEIIEEVENGEGWTTEEGLFHEGMTDLEEFDWDDYYDHPIAFQDAEIIYVNDIPLSNMITADDFLAQCKNKEWDFPQWNADIELDPYDTLYLEFSEDSWCSVLVENKTEEKLPAGECSIADIAIYVDEVEEFRYVGGLNQDSSEADFRQVLGEHCYRDEMEDGSIYYYWAIDDNRDAMAYFEDGRLLMFELLGY